MLRSVILAAARSPRVERLVETAPVTRDVVKRFVAGTRTDDALDTTTGLVGQGLAVTLDHLGEDVPDRAAATRTRDAYLAALEGLAPLGLGRAAEVSVKLSAFGQALPVGGDDVALELVRPVVEAASAQGTTVTLDMEDSGTVDSTLAVLAELRRAHPGTGAVLQAMLHRTEDDARALAVPGSRVRLVKGAYREPPAVAFQGKADVDAAYARCLEVLVRGSGYPMAGTHDPAMIARMLELVTAAGRAPDSYEFQLLYGIRPQEQARLAAAGHTVRAYVPYGADWYGYFMRRLAERPANLQFFLRSLVTKS
jgi:proline dehydrogenase